MSGMMFDPELLRLWQAQAAAAMASPIGMELAKVSAPREALPLPPPPPPPPPPLPAVGADAAAPPVMPTGPNADTAPPGIKPEAIASGGPKGGQPVDLVALLRGLAGIVPRPAAPQRQALSAAPAPSFHRPQTGTLPMRQPIPGNPYLRTAVPGAAAIRPRRRGLLDEG
ncbi:hypothetical protein [Plastoroseomonas hellenica]|uniref:hypothetical protein n=1 Tax=Plastoroseomonas hellenica TaxID=2687306 RepID=UPI001BA704A1|nr:hypothetical protein [Plastoroseomonas hellenica]MBR0647559.1 hypothetical protein [Plastoroseomonas hellenica]